MFLLCLLGQHSYTIRLFVEGDPVRTIDTYMECCFCRKQHGRRVVLL